MKKFLLDFTIISSCALSLVFMFGVKTNSMVYLFYVVPLVCAYFVYFTNEKSIGYSVLSYFLFFAAVIYLIRAVIESVYFEYWGIEIIFLWGKTAYFLLFFLYLFVKPSKE